eukprot:360995-Chlamydomonas_euryale.AAC.3
MGTKAQTGRWQAQRASRRGKQRGQVGEASRGGKSARHAEGPSRRCLAHQGTRLPTKRMSNAPNIHRASRLRAPSALATFPPDYHPPHSLHMFTP